MKGAIRIAMAVGAAVSLCPRTGDAQQNAREAHAIFTGEVKPVLYVSDVERSATFYRDVLGFGFDGYAMTGGAPYYAEMVAGGLKFGLHEPLAEVHRTFVGKQRIYFRVSDLRLHHMQVAARGGNPDEIKVTDWMDMFVVRDPDGNEMVFAFTDPARHPTDPWHASASGSRPGTPR